MTHTRASKSPTGTGMTGGALGRQSNGCALRPYGFRVLSGGLVHRTGLSAENVVTQERPESVTAFLVSRHGGYRIKFKGENNFHQEITGRQTLTVTQIGRVRVRDVYPFRERLVSHSHIRKYGVRVTSRQRVGETVGMDHNIKLSPDMDQMLTLHRDRWIRAQALSTAVVHSQTEVTAGEAPPSAQDIMYRAEEFAEYIREGMVK